MRTDRLSIHYRRKTIIARSTANGWEARAFEGKLPASAIHVRPSSDEAVSAVKAELDQEAAEEIARRGQDGFPTADHVASAFRRIRPTDGQLAMLKAHLRASNQILTATELAAAAGKGSYEYANSQYGRLARDLAEEMEYVPSATNPSDGEPIWTFTIATGVDDDASIVASEEYQEWQWKLRPQVVEALTNLGFP